MQKKNKTEGDNIDIYKKGWEMKQIKMKEIEGLNQSEEIKEIPPIPSTLQTLIKNQNKNKGRSCDTKKQLN